MLLCVDLPGGHLEVMRISRVVACRDISVRSNNEIAPIMTIVCTRVRVPFKRNLIPGNLRARPAPAEVFRYRLERAL